MLTRDTSYGWDTIELSYNGSLEAHRDETFTSHFDIDSKVTTFNTNGTVASTTGTQTWDKTATGTLTRSRDAEAVPGGVLSAGGGDWFSRRGCQLH